MYEVETLWSGARWDIRRELEGRSAGKLKIVDKETGLCDWPIQYQNGSVGFDFPHRIPQHVQQAVKICYGPGSPLKEIRLQLALAFDFLESTPHPDGEHWSWTGSMPYYISEYDPRVWAAGVTFVDRYDGETKQVLDYRAYNTPIWRIWEDALAEMRARGMGRVIEQAEQLPIADLLAASANSIPWSMVK
jgi:hypothetical protein